MPKNLSTILFLYYSINNENNALSLFEPLAIHYIQQTHVLTCIHCEIYWVTIKFISIKYFVRAKTSLLSIYKNKKVLFKNFHCPQINHYITQKQNNALISRILTIECLSCIILSRVPHNSLPVSIVGASWPPLHLDILPARTLKAKTFHFLLWHFRNTSYFNSIMPWHRLIETAW